MIPYIRSLQYTIVFIVDSFYCFSFYCTIQLLDLPGAATCPLYLEFQWPC